MNSNQEQIRTAIAAQAAEWFVANDEAPLDERQAAALSTWFRASPAHVEEFLRVAVIARDLGEAGVDPEHSIATLLERARADNTVEFQPLWSRAFAALKEASAERWRAPAYALAAVAVVGLGLFWLRNPGHPAQVAPVAEVTALHYVTPHGEQQTHQLPDGSVLHLNTDSAVTVRYSKTERLVTLTAGEADFEVTHVRDRPFRVFAGPAEVVDLGTRFDVRLADTSTLVTVVEGRVAVGRSSAARAGGITSNPHNTLTFVQLKADEQVRVSPDQWPPRPVAVDAQRKTAWLRRQIMFENEPLGHVASEFNRYAPKQIEITTPELRSLEISGVFATDNSAAFIAFLRSLDGVQVEVTTTAILVSQK